MKRSSIGEYIGVIAWIFGGLYGLLGLGVIGVSFMIEDANSLVFLISGALIILTAIVSTVFMLGYAQLVKSNEDIKMLLYRMNEEE